MEEFNRNDLAMTLLAELVDALGGVAKLDATHVSDNMRAGRFKSVRVTLENDEVLLEVVDEDQD
jgi:hypothetical protein